MTTKIDPVTTEIIRNAFISIAQDMNATLIRSAYSPIIYEGKDCSVALLDNHGNVLGQSLGLPLFLGNLQVCVQLTAELCGGDYFRPGDVLLMNDSYMTDTHLNDITVFAPIYWQDTLVGFSASRAHWLDVGAKDAGGPMDARSICSRATSSRFRRARWCARTRAAAAAMARRSGVTPNGCAWMSSTATSAAKGRANSTASC